MSSKNPIPRLHLITDDAILGRPDFATVAVTVLEVGGGSLALHLRGRRTTGAALYGLATRLRSLNNGAVMLINDRVDVAVAVAADGAQIPSDGFALRDARRLIGDQKLLGASVHSVEEAQAAANAGADFLLAGTLFETPSHPGRPAAGLAWLKGLVDLGLPVIGIGGITIERVAAVRAEGAAGVAVMRSVWDAASPAEITGKLLAALGAT